MSALDVPISSRNDVESNKVYSTFKVEDENTENNFQTNESSKDGGWGWVIVLSSLMVHVLSDGIIYSYGVLAPEFIKHFGISRSTVGWMGSILVAVTLASGPLASFLCSLFGYRKVAVAGSIISSVAFAMPYFYKELWFLILTSSIICGIGFGLVYLPSIVIINIWFEKKRSLALGIAVSGAGLGTLIFSFLIEFLLLNCGWELTMLITGAILLLLIPCSLTYINLPKENVYKNHSFNKSNETQVETKLSFENQNEINENNLDFQQTSKENVEIDLTNKKNLNYKSSFIEMMKNPIFLLYLTSTVLSSIGFNAPYMFAKDRALQLGISSKGSSFLISFIGIGNFFGRIGFGYLALLKSVNRFHLYNVSITISGLILVISWVMNSYILMIIYAVIYGFMTGAFVTLTSVVLVDIFGLQNLDNVFGYSLVFQGISVLIGPPLTGLIYDITLSYNIAFSVCGILIAASGLIMYLAYLSKEFRQKRFK